MEELAELGPEATASQVVAHLDRLRLQHAPILPQFGDRKVLSFMGTAAEPGRAPAMAIRRVGRLEVAADGVLEVTLAGGLPRAPSPGERIAVSLVDAARFHGFQLKSPVLVDQDRPGRVFEARGGGTVVKVSQVFTVHPTEYTTRFFEEVPVGDVLALAAQLRFALVAVGAHANVSPRFVLHHELDGDAVSLFHGDAALNKTHLNLQANPRETRLIADLDRLSGLVLEGAVEPFTAEEHPAAAEAIVAAFHSAGLGAPRRLLRLRAERWARADVGAAPAP